ncbi:sulfotransferase [Streptomyces sp. NPDC051366]|uniref:sulfotransferase n=1 Tax=Streptomyces sp. NPDC051366 TaxID=3365652 RepID=UPI0037972ACE
MRALTFIVGTGRSGSTALSGILNVHPDVLSLNELLSSVQSRGFHEGLLGGAEFWRLAAGDPRRTGAERVEDLTEEQVRSLPPELSPLLAERFDSALVSDRELSAAGFAALWSELVVRGVARLEDVPAPMWDHALLRGPPR